MRAILKSFLLSACFLILLSLLGCPFLRPNNPPILSIPDQTIRESDEKLLVNLLEYAEDPDNDPLTFQLTQGDKGEIVKIHDEYRYVYYPEYGDAGTYGITIEVADWREGRAEDTFVLTVERFAEEPKNPSPS
ncbi:Ig-like domain-containing protein, partial [Desulfonatronospira sp.]|uniref:Ig-like domain-containing protein n=1 Tax=Desulfonatronospira sp. TaxID=1962951 RepID=UPI0025C02FCB